MPISFRLPVSGMHQVDGAVILRCRTMKIASRVRIFSSPKLLRHGAPGRRGGDPPLHISERVPTAIQVPLYRAAISGPRQLYKRRYTPRQLYKYPCRHIRTQAARRVRFPVSCKIYPCMRLDKCRYTQPLSHTRFSVSCKVAIMENIIYCRA